jgi:hypothetical protein
MSSDTEQTFDLLVKLHEKKAYTATGKKSIASLNSFIEKNYIRVENSKNVLRTLESHGFLEFVSNKYVKFAKFLKNEMEEEEFGRMAIRKIQKSKSHSIRQKYLDRGIISAGTK